MQFQKNVSLKNHNTFGIEVKAENFVTIHSEKELKTVLNTNNQPITILGGGSNVLFTQDIKGLVIKNEIKGIHIKREFKNSIHVSVGAGEVWHDFVLWCIENDYGGVENLSLIPGTVGATPIQNIGAYGVEIKDIFIKLSCISLKNKHTHTIPNKSCKFAYRDSIFKNEPFKGEYCITNVFFRLTKNKHKLHVEYGGIKQALLENNIAKPTIKEVSNIVIAIRKSKLPDPKELGNAGSFFKNPEIKHIDYQRLKIKYVNLPAYPQDNGNVKIAAGWLIEQCGWKGVRVGNTGTHVHQALVLVNYGEASGKEIEILSEKIIQSVWHKFEIKIVAEVNIL